MVSSSRNCPSAASSQKIGGTHTKYWDTAEWTPYGEDTTEEKKKLILLMIYFLSAFKPD